MSFEVSSQADKLLPVGLMRSGEKVIDRHRSHVNLNDEVFVSCLNKTLSCIESEGRDFLVHTQPFESVIGETQCVKTGSDAEEKITYAIRKGRKGYTRFVRERSPEPTNEFTVVLRKGGDGVYILITAFMGPKAEPEPWDPQATEESQRFWRTHALIWNPELVDLKTVENDSPW